MKSKKTKWIQRFKIAFTVFVMILKAEGFSKEQTIKEVEPINNRRTNTRSSYN